MAFKNNYHLKQKLHAYSKLGKTDFKKWNRKLG